MKKARAIALLVTPPLLLMGARSAIRAAVASREQLDVDGLPVPGARIFVRGTAIHVRLSGKGPPVLLLHGFGGSGADWRHVAPLLSDSHALITPDLPGAGFSDHGDRLDLSHKGQAAMMWGLLDRLDIDRVAIAGHSFGAAVALYMACAQPGRVSALALLDGPRIDLGAVPQRSRPVLESLVGLVSVAPPVARWLRGGVLAPHNRERRDLQPDWELQTRIRGSAASLTRALLSSQGQPVNLDVATMPALVYTGAYDGYQTPAAAWLLAEQLPNARVLINPDTGHLPMEERPDECAAALLEFLSRVRNNEWSRV